MKIALQAIVASIIMHVSYIVCMTAVAYIETKNYKPEIISRGEQAIILQDEVVFGIIMSQLSIVFSLVGVAVVCGIILALYRALTRYYWGI